MCRDRPGLWLLLVLAALGLPAARSASGDESIRERRQRLAQMSAEQKNELLRKKQRFGSLPPEEQQRLRRLHEQIAADANAERLRRTLARYNEWLKTLTSDQRAELEGLAAHDRIAKIRQFKQRQEERNFRAFSELKLPPEDLGKILFWANSFLMRHQEEILSWMPPEYRRFVRNADPQRRRRLLIAALARRPPDQKLSLLDQKEIQMLLDRLSPEARQILGADPKLKQSILRWFDQIGAARRLPPISDDQLRRFFQERLSDEQRRGLDHLPIAERKAELRRMYIADKLRQRFQWDGRSGRPPVGSFRRRRGASRSDDRRPPSKDRPPLPRPPD